MPALFLPFRAVPCPRCEGCRPSLRPVRRAEAVAGYRGDSPVGAVGGGGGGTLLETLCSNPYWGLEGRAGVLPTMIKLLPALADPHWPTHAAGGHAAGAPPPPCGPARPQHPGRDGHLTTLNPKPPQQLTACARLCAAEYGADGFSLPGMGSPLHRLARNVGVSEEQLVVMIAAAPQAGWLVDANGCLPLHLLCGNPGHTVDQWALRRLLEVTPVAGLKWLTKAAHCTTALHGLLGLSPACGRVAAATKKSQAPPALLLEMAQELFNACTDGNTGEGPDALASRHLEAARSCCREFGRPAVAEQSLSSR